MGLKTAPLRCQFILFSDFTPVKNKTEIGEPYLRCGQTDTLFIVVLYFFVSHHDVGDDSEDFVMTSSASRGAVGYFLYIFERFENVIELLHFLKCVRDVEKADFFTVAYHVVFFHDKFSFRRILLKYK